MLMLKVLCLINLVAKFIFILFLSGFPVTVVNKEQIFWTNHCGADMQQTNHNPVFGAASV